MKWKKKGGEFAEKKGKTSFLDRLLQKYSNKFSNFLHHERKILNAFEGLFAMLNFTASEIMCSTFKFGKKNTIWKNVLRRIFFKKIILCNRSLT